MPRSSMIFAPAHGLLFWEADFFYVVGPIRRGGGRSDHEEKRGGGLGISDSTTKNNIFFRVDLCVLNGLLLCNN